VPTSPSVLNWPDARREALNSNRQRHDVEENCDRVEHERNRDQAEHLQERTREEEPDPRVRRERDSGVHLGANRQRHVAGRVLKCVARLVRSDGGSGDRGRLVHRGREEERALARVVVVGERTARRLLDRDIVQPVAVEDLACDRGAGQAAR
jgi:hypothetical protein